LYTPRAPTSTLFPYTTLFRSEHYFGPRSQLDLPVMLLENKVLDLGGSQDVVSCGPRLPDSGVPWRIGWFGALRCRRSLAMLCDLDRKSTRLNSSHVKISYAVF